MAYGRKEKRHLSNWTPDRIKKLRAGYRESQPRFARRLKISADSIRVWEQGRGTPSGPAEVLLDRLQEDLEAGNIRPHPEDVLTAAS